MRSRDLTRATRILVHRLPNLAGVAGLAEQRRLDRVPSRGVGPRRGGSVRRPRRPHRGGWAPTGGARFAAAAAITDTEADSAWGVVQQARAELCQLLDGAV